MGLDVGEQQINVFIHDRGIRFSIDNDAAGIRESLNPSRDIKCRGGGGGKTDACRGIPVIICLPLKVRRYAGANGVLAKTDKIDAEVLADYAAVMKPAVRPIALGHIRQIKDLSVRRRRLVQMNMMEKNYLDVMPKSLHADLKRHIRHLDSQTA